jgi:transposase InsO family protein
MVAALASRDLGQRVNRKRVQRLMREHRLLQRHRPLGRRRRPGFFRVERPDQLWHMDMTSVWVAEHGWRYLNAIIDCCTREICGWALDVRCTGTTDSRRLSVASRDGEHSAVRAPQCPSCLNAALRTSPPSLGPSVMTRVPHRGDPSVGG